MAMPLVSRNPNTLTTHTPSSTPASIKTLKTARHTICSSGIPGFPLLCSPPLNQVTPIYPQCLSPMEPPAKTRPHLPTTKKLQTGSEIDWRNAKTGFQKTRIDQRCTQLHWMLYLEAHSLTNLRYPVFRFRNDIKTHSTIYTLALFLSIAIPLFATNELRITGAGATQGAGGVSFFGTMLSALG